MSRYVIAYDISSDTLRSNVRSVCRKYGARQQYSLFEVRLSETEKAKLIDELQQVVSAGESPRVHIRIYSVGKRDNDVDIPEPASSDEKPANIV